MLSEEWRPIDGYEGAYSVSDMGRIRRNWDPQGRAVGILNFGAVRGYPMVSLSLHGSARRFMVHRLVAVAFLGPIPPGCQVHHKNSQRGDARAENLKYVTASDNVRATYASGRIALRGERNGNAKISDAKALEIRRLYTEGMRQAEIARRCSVSKTCVFQIVHRRTYWHL